MTGNSSGYLSVYVNWMTQVTKKQQNIRATKYNVKEKLLHHIIITSHAGLKGLYIREIALKYCIINT